MRAKKVLISYSHKDEIFRSSLVNALSGAVRNGALEIWTDHQILPGQVLDDQIMANLKEADVVILLVSPDFIASDYCYKKELQIALERHENGRAVVVPVVVRATDWHGMPFSALMMLPLDARPVSSWENVDEAWLSVAQGIRRLFEQMPDDRPQSQVETKAINQCLVEVFEELEARYSKPETYQSAKFGFSFGSLDEAVGGVFPSEWLVLASRPDHGHVELAHALVLDAALKGKKRVFVCSQRLTSSQFTNRLLCNLGRLSRLRFSRGLLEDEDWSRVTASIRLLKDADLVIDDDPIRSLTELSKKLKEIGRGAFEVVLIDGLEYISDQSDERKIALAISDFTKRSRVAMIGTVSLGPEMEMRAYRKPLLVDLKEWRLVESLADKIVFSTREWRGSGAGPDELSDSCEISLVRSSEGVSAAFPARYYHGYGIVNGLDVIS